MNLSQYKTQQLSDVFDACESQILHVMDGEGDDAVNVASAQIRHLGGDLWIVVDDTDGYQIFEEHEIEDLCLVLPTDPSVQNRWDAQGNVVRG